MIRRRARGRRTTDAIKRKKPRRRSMLMPSEVAIEDTARALRGIKGITVRTNELMAGHTSFGIGGPADLFVIATSISNLSEVMRTLHELGVPAVLLGNGTNVLVRDGGIRGAVIKLGGELAELQAVGNMVIAGAGASLATLCRYCADHNLGGLMFAAGIPGSVGGAVLMNAGANGGEMADVVRWVLVVGYDGKVAKLGAEELGFGYRSSRLQDRRCAVAQVGFQLEPSEGAAVHRALCEVIQRRCRTQPVAQRSAGSIFKRPENDYAGRLLEGAGVKGLAVGDAMVSPKHANFIINKGHATSRDVLALIELMREKVAKKFGVYLETEIVTLGEE